MRTKLYAILIAVLTLFSTIGIIHPTLQGKDNAAPTQDPRLAGCELIDRGQTWNKYYNPQTKEYSLETYENIVNYQDEQQTWKPIDTTIVPLQKSICGRDYSYGMINASYRAYFQNISSMTNDQPIVLTKDAYLFSFTPMNSVNFNDGTQAYTKETVSGHVEGNSITYPGQYGEGIDLVFNCFEYGIKSMYTIDSLRNLPAHEPANTTMDFTENINAYDAKIGKDNETLGITYGNDNNQFKEYGKWENKTITTSEGISFQNQGQNTIFSIPPLFAWDTSSEASAVILNKTLYMTSTGCLWIDIHVPTVWLSNTSRVYPIYVDPTVTIYSTTNDGYIDKSNSNYLTTWAYLTGNVHDAYNYMTVGQQLWSPPISAYTIYRGFLFFNTSSITKNATITSAVISLYGKSKQVTSKNFDLILQNGQPTSPNSSLLAKDYYQGNYSGNGGSINTTGFITTGYNNITMNALGQTWINQTNLTKLCLRSSRDINKNSPTTQNPNEHVEIYTSEKGVGYKPKCIITYKLRLSIAINFVGNLGDKGGPYWRPPGESVRLTGAWENGYYTNDSRQQEHWMYINVTVTQPPELGNQYNVSHVWLQWLNDTTWTNWTYAFSHTGAYWEYNTSGHIQTHEGYDYSFNIVANDTKGNSNCMPWNKTGIGGYATRRYVQLGCNQTNISYTPLYLFNYTSGTGSPPTYRYDDQVKRDRLHHDQGPDGTLNDSGYLSYYNQILNDTMHLRYCGGFVGYFFDDSICVKPFILKNIYYHVWSSSSSSSITFYWRKTREAAIGGSPGNDAIFFRNSSDSRSEIYWNNHLDFLSDSYYLCTSFRNSTSLEYFTDNNIFEFLFEADISFNPSVICNRSIVSFILINIPDNATLRTHDSDNDSLTDWEELFVTYTNPFLADTDNDGINDKTEIHNRTDPNNFLSH